MDSQQQILKEAITIIEERGNILSPETNTILYFFVSPEKIDRFSDNDLYLKFIKKLINEQYNISFPEQIEPYHIFFDDCIQLKNIMKKSSGSFSEDLYLKYISLLLENLKTPYYKAYAEMLLYLEPCFNHADIFQKTLQNFYSVLIKSPSRKIELIRRIIKTAPDFVPHTYITEQLYSDLLLHTLGIFGTEKNIWIASIYEMVYHKAITSVSAIDEFQLFHDFHRKEIDFLSSFSPTEALSLAEYLSERTLWFMKDSSINNTRSIESDHLDIDGQKIESEFLNKYAYNMNMRSYITNPAICREQEIRDLELILISPKKSPILIGEAGVGKTSVVESLVYRLQRGDVPDLLKTKKIFKLTTTSLLSGTKYVGEMEDRIKQLMDELEKYPDIILFIDEIHTIVGAGSTESSNNDISNMLKPYIDRGDIKIIGATTKEEYINYLLPDKALARRFYPVNIEEPDDSMTLSILLGTIPFIEHETKVKNMFSQEQTEIYIQKLISLSKVENQPADMPTKLPELPLTLLEMAFSYASLYSRPQLSVEDLIMAVEHTNRLNNAVKKNAGTYFS